MKNNLTPETMAAHLFQMFQSHAIDIPQDKRKEHDKHDKKSQI